MKQKIIQYIENLIQEHEESGYCTDYKEAGHSPFVESLDKFYDVGRYETLTNLLTDIKNMEE